MVPQFKRKIEILPGEEAQLPRPCFALPAGGETTVLVINASAQMAKEITYQLSLAIPGCAITYSPSLELARFALSRKKFSLILSSSVLPDGSVHELRNYLERFADVPDLVVIDDRTSEPRIIRRQVKPATRPASVQQTPPSPNQAIKKLGEDLRNDLNNPLQEIVAMVYVAQAGGEKNPVVLQALEAINNAASSMAKVVRSLESSILKSVGNS